MLLRLKRAYSTIWPFVFLVCGVIAVVSGGHLHFTVFDRTVSFHTLMWFFMAFAHADAIWGGRHGEPTPAAPADEIGQAR